MDQSLDILASTTADWGIPLSEAQLAQFALYADTLLQWNKHVNLTAITDYKGIMVRHFLDALRCARSWGNAPYSLIDIGSGAGLPGLPLKLLWPSLELTLVESVRKKATFLQHMVDRLGLSAVTILTQRAEVVGRDPYHRERYDVATARAVATLNVLAEYCLPLLRLGGRFLAPKGADIAVEIDRARSAWTTLGGQLLAVEPVHLPDLEPRTLVIVEKIAPTPLRYPRGIGMPARRPL